MTELMAQIIQTVDQMVWPTPNARKSYGQYKAILIHNSGRTEILGKIERPLIWRGAEPLPGGPTHFVRGKVFETREDAIQYATDNIQIQKENMIKRMQEPRYRALRKQYGLPEEI